ncbi:MAG: hypothetical protein NTV52_07425 [Acidobacteria bacterium]|nr:hypothetical protein [Acidobacteriota bacterium]
MTRRLSLVSLAAGLTASLSSAQPNPSGDWILNLLRASMEAKKGVTLHIKGQTVAMLVTAIGDHFVEGRSQQSSKIVVRLDSIDAVAMA